MSKLVLHTSTTQWLQDFTERPTHATLLLGAAGIGKASIARELAANIIGKPIESLSDQPYVRIIRMDEKARSISIEAVRELEHFLLRKVPGDAPRVVIIEDAHGLTTEAQNALLKTLEEPAGGTILILTAAGAQSLLPTIRSRATSLTIQKPPATDLTDYFKEQGYADTNIRQALLMSGGLPGLMDALLREDTEHPLAQAATTARAIIQKSTFERLAMVDILAKDREQCLHVLDILQRMAQISLAGGNTAKTWQRILQQSYQTAELLHNSAQPKLALTNLMLNL